MPVTFSALDNEFAAATGRNVNNNVGGPGTSRIDHPPSAMTNLRITASADDPDPRSFEVGDTYNISFDSRGGGVHLENATVIRSDEIRFSTGHVVVFEGTDGKGKLVQVIWTPGFNLEQWYWDNYHSGARPGFYTYDRNPGGEYTAPVICFEAETLIATPRGPVRAASLVPGMMVETVDHGPQMLLWVGQSVTRGTGPMAPVEFPAGAIGNDRPLVLSQQHRVLHASAMAALMFAAPEVLISARAHVTAGACGARIVERPVVRYVHLLFERHELVLAEGAVCESLYLGDVARRALDLEAREEIAVHFPELDLGIGGGCAIEAVRPLLRSYEAQALLALPGAPHRPAPHPARACSGAPVPPSRHATAARHATAV